MHLHRVRVGIGMFRVDQQNLPYPEGAMGEAAILVRQVRNFFGKVFATVAVGILMQWDSLGAERRFIASECPQELDTIDVRRAF